jgi:hypothetical protein
MESGSPFTLGATDRGVYKFCLHRLGEILPIFVRPYDVPGLKHDLVSVKGLNQSGYRVIHDADEEESGVFAVNNKKIISIYE